jgi:transposase
MYSLDRRKLATHVYTLFSSLRKAAKVLQVSHSTVSRWLKNPDKKPYKRYTSKSSTIVETIRVAIVSNPFISIRDLQVLIKEVFHFSVSKELVRIAIQRLGITKKKARFFSQPKNLEQKTKEFIFERNQYIAEDRYFVSLDETSFGRHGKEMKGYAPKGEQLLIRRSQPRRTTISSLVIVDREKIIKRLEIQGSFNTQSFYNFLNHLEVPVGTVILLDNVSFHHSKVVKELATTKGFILLYTPPYSPWFNPIEGVFSIVKREYYKHGCIDRSYGVLRPCHCQAFFQKSLST